MTTHTIFPSVDCSGTYILPGLIDGFGGLNSQAQANAWLYMGVTTIVGLQDERRGMLKRDAHPSPHIYPFDGGEFIDRYSFLFSLPQWRSKVKEGEDFANLNEQETKDQLKELAQNGTRVIWLGQEITPEQTKPIVKEGHKLGLATYGEFISTRYSDALQDGIDVLLHMSRYELGLIPEELHKSPLRDHFGPGLAPAYAYLRQLDPANPSIMAYGQQISASHAALMPTLSLSYLQLPNHRISGKSRPRLFSIRRVYICPPTPKRGKRQQNMPSTTRGISQARTTFNFGQSTTPSRQHIQSISRARVPLHLARCRASPCTRNWNCWFA